LAREKVPERWFVVDEIPKTDRGKINRDNVAKYCLVQGRG
jgi:acyl-coenzyme A synthetase/AMP-(fatty) acid ligase